VTARRVFSTALAALVTLVFWLLRRRTWAVKGTLAAFGLLVPIALAAVVPISVEVWLEGIFLGAACGTISAVGKSDSAYIRGMAVLPSARGSGVGAALLQRAEDWAMRQRCLRLFLSTTPFLSSAIGLYERSGFRRVEQGPHELFGTPLFTMEKNLVGSK